MAPGLRPATTRQVRQFEWPTLVLLMLCYAVWAASTTWIAAQSLWVGIAGVALSAALHSSLSHEALHGHPSRRPLLNAVLVFPALTLVVPYLRFKATHLAHHHDDSLTDPYDDPESNYRDPAAWGRMGAWQRWLLGLNNTLAGRLLIGPALGTLSFVGAEVRAHRGGDSDVLRGWLWHGPALLPVLVWQVGWAQMPLWALLLGSYGALSILKIRTFLEHQAHARAEGRTVVIEDRGLLAFLFLNNNLHLVHHMHPGCPWYALPGLFRARRAHYLQRNGGYYYRNYAQVFGLYFRRAKDPVPHPIWTSPADPAYRRE